MSKEGRNNIKDSKARREAILRNAVVANNYSKKALAQATLARKFSGSVVSVGSRTGKVLLNSSEFEKIMAAIRKTSKGQKTRTVKISVETANRVISVER